MRTERGTERDGAGAQRGQDGDGEGRSGASRSPPPGARPLSGVARGSERAFGQRGRAVDRSAPDTRELGRAAVRWQLREGRRRAGPRSGPAPPPGR